jgi:murein DD-endopeptidase MepM/ murein hydrolase activator NlpD
MKNKFKNKFLVVSLIALSVFFVGKNFARGESVIEILQGKIENNTNEISKIEAEIKAYQEQLNTVSGQAHTLSNAVKELDLSRKKLSAEISLTEKKITEKNNKIYSLSGEISTKDVLLDQNKKAFAKSIAKIDRIEQQPIVHLILGHEKISEALGQIDSLKSLQASLKDNATEVFSVREDLKETKTSEEKLKNELVFLKSELQDQQKILDGNAAEKKRLLDSTKNQEALYKKALAEKEALKNAFEAEIQSYESQLSYVLNPNSIPAPGSAPLSWPLSSVIITQAFGKTADSGRLYASGSHSGVDMGASVGTPVYAMADGVVGGTGDTDLACRGASFGKWILIKYDNNLASTYGHLSLIKVTSGQRVKRGELVGYSGNTGHSTGPHLHTSLYPADAVDVSPKESIACKGKILNQPTAATTAYLDPLQYMPRATSGMFKAGVSYKY